MEANYCFRLRLDNGGEFARYLAQGSTERLIAIRTEAISVIVELLVCLEGRLIPIHQIRE